MFSDEILEMIFANKEAQKVPIGFQSTMIHVVEEVLEEAGYVLINTAIKEEDDY